MMAPGKFQGSSRGIFGLKTWKIPRMPFSVTSSDKSPVTEKVVVDVLSKNSETHSAKPVERVAPQPRQDPVKNDAVFIAKNSYKANSESPLGAELTMTQGDKLKFLERYDDNWWLVEDKLGQIGYVPASYLVAYESIAKPKGLPWLDSQKDETEEDNSVERKYYKKYVSTYEHEEIKKAKLKEFYCEICDKQLNGPQPFRAHMNSKAHKETVEYYKEDERDL